MITKCLYCYEALDAGEKDFHSRCSKKMFGAAEVPLLPYTEDNLEKLAEEVIRSHTSVTGVQPKLSLHLEKDKNNVKKFTIVGLWGGYILKPPGPQYPQLPEVEHLTMRMAAIAKIKTVPHSLIKLQSGAIAYITKRVDRIGQEKLHMEDMCQLTERLTEDKYNGSYEQIAKVIKKYSATPGLDTINFFELVLFSFLIGNADMHLKNFSLIYQPNLGIVLSPAYDLVATTLVNPADDEDFALTMNGKKKKIKKNDFIAAFNTANLGEKQQWNIFQKMQHSLPLWVDLIEKSFLSNKFKAAYRNILSERFNRLN